MRKKREKGLPTDPKAVAKLIDVPVGQWPGNCFAIARRCVRRGVVRGRVAYGHYRGVIADDCPNFGGRVFTHHGWVETETGKIWDPTYWCFGSPGTQPFIHVTSINDPDYDKGGNRLKEAVLRPPPPFREDQRAEIFVHLEPELVHFIRRTLQLAPGETLLTVEQAAYLASLPIDWYGEAVEPIYRWVQETFGPELIPLDNRLAVLGARSRSLR